MANIESRSDKTGTPGQAKTQDAMQRPTQTAMQGERDPGIGRAGPLGLMRRLTEDMDRFFGGFFGMRPWEERPFFDLRGLADWPELEVYRRDSKLVVRADVPGLRKEDVSVEVRDDRLCIAGERRLESEQTGREYYRAERSYGSFCRTIRLPEGAKVDTASATFQNGVLEVEIEVPEQAPRGRRIEVREQPSH
jgi:HSP20 family protein